MSNDIRIRKGLDIHLEGEADKVTKQLPLSPLYGIKPSDFHRIIPKLLLREGNEVKAGEALFFSKSDERILFPSPVSGTIKEIIRGERRKVLVSRGHLGGLSCAAAVQCSGVAVAWRSVGVRAEQVASVLEKAEVGKVR